MLNGMTPASLLFRSHVLRSINVPNFQLTLLSIGTTYLDHAATTPAPSSLLSAFSKELTTNLYGNPHSGSSSSQLSTRRIEDTRHRLLRFLNADPADFEVVFVANATAGVKLVADAFRDAGDEGHGKGFAYAYLNEVHTSLVGVREMAKAGSCCLDEEQDVESWLQNCEREQSGQLQLFAYPGQSNMNGFRPDPRRRWCKRIQRVRRRSCQPIYTLFDAAGLVSTSPLDLSNPFTAPDFTVLSFYKIFGFPDLGALIVRKASADILKKRRYFGGGTVEMVVTGNSPWHSMKDESIHARLEDGTVPFHSTIALDLAMVEHERIFGSMEDVAIHTGSLAEETATRLADLKHTNGEPVCRIFKPDGLTYGQDLGPVIAFNLKDSQGDWIGKSEVEKLATVNNIQLRTGTLCNPGGTALYLGLTAEDMRKNFSMGQRCGDEHDLMNGRPTGVLRISFGAMSSMEDVENLIGFIEEFYVDKTAPCFKPTNCSHQMTSQFYIDSLTVFPIKSCAGYTIPSNQTWEVRPEGLAWDREWCLVHQGTGHALSQKRYPRMALLRPSMDLKNNFLKVSHNIEGTTKSTLEIPLWNTSRDVTTTEISICTKLSSSSLRVCGDTIQIQLYTSPSTISTFFTEALGVPCTLARFPPRSSFTPRLAKFSMPSNLHPSSNDMKGIGRNILLSNESPILMISRSSLNHLNQQIESSSSHGTKKAAVPAEAFRANIIIAQSTSPSSSPDESPYVEDTWSSLQISSSSDILNTGVEMEVLGPCKRCTMINNPQSPHDGLEKVLAKGEPYATLAKTRRWDGGVWFGVHLSPLLLRSASDGIRDGDGDGRSGKKKKEEEGCFVKVGDRITALSK